MTSKRIVVVRDFEQLNADEAGPSRRARRPARDDRARVRRRRRPGAEEPRRRAEGRGGRRPRLGEDGRRARGRARAGRRRPCRTDAARSCAERLGDDAGRVAGLVEVLAAAFGPGATLTADEVEPYLGEAGSVPVFQLTNAIEEGKVASALSILRPAAHRHERAPAQADASAPGARAAAVALPQAAPARRPGDPHARRTRTPRSAGRAARTRRRRRSRPRRRSARDGLRTAVDSLHRADLDLKGASAMPEDAVLEVLVARLAALALTQPGGRSGSRR